MLPQHWSCIAERPADDDDWADDWAEQGRRWVVVMGRETICTGMPRQSLASRPAGLDRCRAAVQKTRASMANWQQVNGWARWKRHRQLEQTGGSPCKKVVADERERKGDSEQAGRQAAGAGRRHSGSPANPCGQVGCRTALGTSQQVAVLGLDKAWRPFPDAAADFLLCVFFKHESSISG